MLASKFLPRSIFLVVVLFALGGSARAQDFETWGETFDVTPWFDAAPVRVWGGVDFLLWWRRGQSTPPLVTTGTTGIIDPILGPDTQVLFGGDPLRADMRPGGRVTLGVWVDPYETIGVEANFWAVGRQTTRFHLDSDGTTLLAVPFNDTTIGPNAFVVAAPGQSGTVDIRETSDVLGGDFLLRGALLRDMGVRLDWLAGYQTAVIDEGLVLVTNAGTNGPVQIDTLDAFGTKNNYHAGALGFSGSVRRGGWTLDLLGKVGMGNMRQSVTINGANTVSPPPVTTPGGVFAQPTNIGTFTRDQFSWAPEAGVKLAYNFNPFSRVTLGYSFLYYTNVVQPGPHIDDTINPTQVQGGVLVGDARPAFAFNANGYWIQGVTLGVDWRF